MAAAEAAASVQGAVGRKWGSGAQSRDLSGCDCVVVIAVRVHELTAACGRSGECRSTTRFPFQP